MTKVLIAEEDRDLRGVIKFVLVTAGYEVSEASDGPTTLQKANEERPDLILLDLLIPGLDSVEALKTLRENSETAGIPLVLLSPEGHDGVAAAEPNPLDTLNKPFTAKELESKVRLAIDKSRLSNQVKTDSEVTAGNVDSQLDSNKPRESKPEKKPKTVRQSEARAVPTIESEPSSESSEEQHALSNPFPLSVKPVAIGMLVVLLVVSTLMILGVFRTLPIGIVGDADIGELWTHVPFVDGDVELEDYQRWSPWVNCLSDNVTAEDRNQAEFAGEAEMT